MIHFARERALEIVEEINSLIPLHHEEISHLKEYKLLPDYDLYFKADQAGGLRIFTARRDRELIGYAFFVVGSHAHHREICQATATLLYIHPHHRGFGMKFLAWCDEELKKETVHLVQHSVTTQMNYGKLLKRMGYVPSELLYVRKLQ